MIADILTTRLVVVAKKLGLLLTEVVFVGGSVLPLLLTDPGARDVRNTEDIDVVVALASKVEWYALEQTLKTRGFSPAGGAAPICRFVRGALILDVMPSEVDVLGFSNRWYPDALATAELYRLDEVTIRVISAPCFVAAKLEAYASRGNDDFIVSHDIEDIVAVLDGRPELCGEISSASVELSEYLAATMLQLSCHHAFAEGLDGHVAGDLGRAALVEERWRAIAAGL